MQPNQVAGANRRWRLSFRCRGSRHESAVAQLFSLDHRAPMPSYKLLNGVAHDIMDHAMSGLSYLHPHLTQTCRTAQIANMTLDLMSESPLSATIPQYQPLVLASQALHQTFVAILAKMGFTLADLSAARLTFHVSPNAPDDYSYVSCTSEIVSARGRSYRHEMPPYCTQSVA